MIKTGASLTEGLVEFAHVSDKPCRRFPLVIVRL